VKDIRDKVYWIWLAGVPGIGARRFRYLLEIYGSPLNIWQASDKEIVAGAGRLGSRVAENIIAYRQDRYLKEAAEVLELPGIRIITLMDEEYPWILKQIYDPPAVLYCKGRDMDFSKPAIAIVGSRSPTAYGRQIAEKLAFQLASAGITIISGLARGIDTMAHIGALRAKGNTIGVIGNGIDIVYPPENKKLFNRMELEGTIITEYPPGTKPLPGNFPARNRIISGLSNGVLVVEAGKRSGALITADFALEQGREVYAVPGNINNPQSMGTNNILKQGAKFVTCVEDILEDLGLEKIQEENKHSIKPVQLDIFETQVYNALGEGEKHLEQLANDTKMDMARLNAVLTILEIKGVVKQMPGKIFIRNDNV
jgi:DNA protecting protein DprA